MYNKKALSKAKAELDKAKAPAKPKDMITDRMGQWKYPGLNTRIPNNGSNDLPITMDGVYRPLLAIASTGEKKVLNPNENHTFRGAKYVDEYPMKKGGTKKRKTKSISGTNKLLEVNELFKNYKNRRFDPKAKHFQDGGEYIEADLTDDEIEEYRKGGYIVEDISVPELSQAQKGKTIKSKDGTVTNTITKANGDTVIQVKNKNGEYYEKLIKKSDALDTLSKLQGAVKPEFQALGNAKAETNRQEKEEKKEKQKFLKKAWSDYDKWSTVDKASDRVGAFLNDPFGMTARAVLGKQAYIPGMAQGLHNNENPEIRERYLKELGYTPGEFDASDVQNIINPGYWASSFVENSRKGNIGTAALEGALMFLPHLPKGTVSKSNIKSGAKLLKDDVKNAGEYLTTNWLKGYKEVPKQLPGSNNNVTFYHGGLDPNATLDDIDLFKLAARQQKKGRDYAGFYMSPDIEKGSFALGYHLNNPSSGLHKIELPSNSKAYEYSGSMERIKKSELEKLKEQGYDYIKGKNIFGQPEFVLLNKDKARLTEVSKQLPGSSNVAKEFGLSIDELGTEGIVNKNVKEEITHPFGKNSSPYLRTGQVEYENGLKLKTYSDVKTKEPNLISIENPKTGETISYTRKTTLDDNWKPVYSNEWSIKADMSSADKDLIKFANKELEKIIPVKPIKTESSTISTDGLRYWDQQQKHGYSTIDKFTTPQVSAAGKDDLFKGLNYKSMTDDSFAAVEFATRKDATEGAARLENFMKNQGLDYKVIINNDNTLQINLPKLQRAFSMGGIITPLAAIGAEAMQKKKQGGIVADLTPEEIQDYIAQGYNIEELDEPELDQAKKGKSVNTSKSPKPSVYIAKNDKDYAFRKKAYDDSLAMYNLSTLNNMLANNYEKDPDVSEKEQIEYAKKNDAYIQKMKNVKAQALTKFGDVYGKQTKPTQTIVKPYKPEADETNKKSNTNKTKETILEISDPKEFAYRNKMYNDSLDLYNYSNKQIADKTKRFGSDAVGVKKEYNKKKAAEFLKEQLKTYGDLAHDPKDKYGKLITKLVKKSNISPIGLSINVEDYDYIFKKPTQKVVLKTESKPVQDTIIQKPVVQQEVKPVIQQNVKPVQKTGYPQGYQPYSLYGRVLDPEVYGYAESLNGKPVQVAQFADTYGYKAKMDTYKKSGQYPWKKQKGGMVAQLTPKEIQEYINQGYIVEEH